MRKRVLIGTGIAAALTVMFFLGSLSLGPVLAHTSDNSTPAQVAVQSPNAEGQSPSYAGSITVDEAQREGTGEANEAVALQSEATISAADAEAVALTANPGANVVKTKLDNENGVQVYSVELSNDKDVKVDAGTGKILSTEAGETDNQNESGERQTVED